MGLPYNITLKQRARELRLNPTNAERIVWKKILSNDKMLGFRFLRQKPIDGFIVDFYCAKLKLVIEIDGSSHDEKENYDFERECILKKYRLNILRICNNDVLCNLNKVRNEIINNIEALIGRPLLAKGEVPEGRRRL